MDYETKNGGTAAAADGKTLADRSAGVGGSNRPSKLLKWIKKDYGCYLFLLPMIIGFFIFTAYPVITSLIYSFTDYNGLFYTKLGLENYQNMFDFSFSGLGKDVFKSFGVTFEWALISIPLGLVLSFMLALLASKEVKGVGVYRLLFYMPTIIPSIAISFIWADTFSSDGLANQLLLSLGLPLSMWLEGESTALWTLILTGVWGIGGNMIMWLASLRNIPPELYEAASLDGAGYFTNLFRITIPLCTPMIFYNLLNALIGAMQAFDVYAMVGHGPNDSLYFISIRIYETAFGSGNEYGLACAMGWLMFAVIAVLTLIMFKTNNWVNYGEES